MATIEIKEVNVVTDTALDARRSIRLSTEIGDAIASAWRERGERRRLVIDFLVIDARARDLARPGFAREVARSTVRRLWQTWRGS